MPSAPTPAFVLWFGPTGLTIARSLGRRGVPVVAFHHDPNEPSTGTRYARVRILPALEQDESAWLAALLEEGRRLGGERAPLFVASDAMWLFVARHREALSQHFAIPLPPAPDIADWISKSWQYAAAQRAGITCPRTVVPASYAELERTCAQLEFPCIVKPTLSHLWVRRFPSKLAFVRTRDELLVCGRAAFDAGLAFTVQEFIPADDSDVHGLHSYVDPTGRMTGACVVRKVRQYAPRFGSSCMSMSVDEPRVFELGFRFLESIGWRGISSVEFKRDRRDGEFKMMEANLRAPLLMAVAIDSGADLPYLAYCDLSGRPPPAPRPLRLGRRVGLFQQDIYSARFYRQIGELSLLGWWWSWLRTRDLHFAWDDWRPFRGYVHMLIDKLKKGQLRGLPPDFPTFEQWNSGQPPPGSRRERLGEETCGAAVLYDSRDCRMRGGPNADG